jgi:hypothetical protein
LSRAVLPSEPDTDRRLQAAKQIARIERQLGARGCELARLVLWNKYSFARILEIQGLSKQSDAEYHGRRFRECLDVIAAELGYQHSAAMKSGPHRERDTFDALAPLADNPQLYAAVHRAKR